jgi:hypothetical protein
VTRVLLLLRILYSSVKNYWYKKRLSSTGPNLLEVRSHTSTTVSGTSTKVELSESGFMMSKQELYMMEVLLQKIVSLIIEDKYLYLLIQLDRFQAFVRRLGTVSVAFLEVFVCDDRVQFSRGNFC